MTILQRNQTVQMYFRKDYAVIGCDEAHAAIVFKWLTSPKPNEFREAMDTVISAIEYFKTGKVIWDVANRHSIHPKDEVWETRNWLNRALKAGYEYGAFILPKDVFSLLAPAGVLDEIKGTTPGFGYFDDINSALEWMKRV